MRRLMITAALVACGALALAGPAAAKPGHGPGKGPRCAVDHETPSAETVAEHVTNAYAAIEAFNAAVAVPDDAAAAGALRDYAAESKLAICESKKVDGPPPEIDTLEALGDMHVAALTAFDAAYDTASADLQRPLRRAIVHEKRSCEKVVKVLGRMSDSGELTPEDQTRVDALIAEYEAACDAVEVPAGAGPERPERPERPDRPDRPERPGPGGPGGSSGSGGDGS
jgi:hypothetical protein